MQPGRWAVFAKKMPSAAIAIVPQNRYKSIMPNETKNQEATAKFESGKAHVVQAAGDLREAAEAKARELRSIAEAKAGEYKHKAEQAYDDARTRARSFREDGEAYVRDNPTRAVFTALGIGFVLGLIFRR